MGNRTDLVAVTLSTNINEIGNKLERVSYSMNGSVFDDETNTVTVSYYDAPCAAANTSFCAMAIPSPYNNCLYDENGTVVPGIIGSPLMNASSLTQVGIYSWEPMGCNNASGGLLSIYTATSLFTSWIQSELAPIITTTDSLETTSDTADNQVATQVDAFSSTDVNGED